jgi:cyclophilin family peptidyl-prolyl cis-trans isomerase
MRAAALLSLACGEVVVRCASTKGNFDITVHEDWAPLGAERFLDLVRHGVLDGTVLYRVVPNFLVQFGVPRGEIPRKYVSRLSNIKDDPPFRPSSGRKFKRGYVSFAGGGKNSRKADMFISFTDTDGLGNSPWETPFGSISLDGMEVVDRFEGKYGDLKDFGGRAPDFGKLWSQGYDFLAKEYPDIDYLLHCSEALDIEDDASESGAKPIAGADVAAVIAPVGGGSSILINDLNNKRIPSPVWLLMAASFIIVGKICILPDRQALVAGKGRMPRAFVLMAVLFCALGSALAVVRPDLADGLLLVALGLQG